MSDSNVSSSYRNLLLPEEIVVEILLRLPSKSLIRSKSVCKRWYDLISKPKFLLKHLLPARDNDNNVLLVNRCDNANQDPVFSLLSGHNLAHRSQTRPLPYPEMPEIPFDEDTMYFDYSGYEVEIEVLGPCNGLVCLFDTNSHTNRYIVLWRLADGEVKILPPSDVPHPMHTPPTDVIENPQIGFGYDPIDEDYKVIRMGVLVEVGRPFNKKVEMYSFKHDSWKGLAYDDTMPFPHGCLSVACVNGMCFWWTTHNCIVRFRISDESFGTISGPVDIENLALRFDSLGELLDIDEYVGNVTGPYWNYDLFVLNDEKFALVVYDIRSRTEKCFHIWVLLEFSVEESWTRLFTIGPLMRMERHVWFWTNDKIIIENVDGELILCDLFTSKTEPLNICGLPRSSRIISIEDKYIL